MTIVNTNFFACFFSRQRLKIKHRTGRTKRFPMWKIEYNFSYGTGLCTSSTAREANRRCVCERDRKTGHLQKLMNVKVSPSDLPNARQSRAEIYSKSICILFKQQFVSALPRLILYSLFDFKFPKGIIININWSFISTSYTWMYRVITKIRRGRSIKAHFSVMISYTAPFFAPGSSSPSFSSSFPTAVVMKLSTENTMPYVSSI